MNRPRKKYKPQHLKTQEQIESAWDAIGLNKTEIESSEKPFYNLMMFPYPSAEGLHVGNMYAFTGSDIYGRFKSLQGHDVFEPIGLDGFGIHSENFAMKIGRHPMDHAEITQTNYYKQLKSIGAMFDWDKTVETYDEDYYTWTQWLFVQMFKAGLAYRDTAEVNWCPQCKTVLADEQVIDSKCERCGNTVIKKQLEQWFFRITAYAEKLLTNLRSLKWSHKVKVAQENWIGKKVGIDILYPVFLPKKSGDEEIAVIKCFTTRPDTNFGATFVVISPEHPIVRELTEVLGAKKARAIEKYVNEAKQKSSEQRIEQGREKTGIDTGLYCVNQLNGYKMPLYISDFVLGEVGTGAVVGVPGHDTRDFEFAQTFEIPVKRVVIAGEEKESDEIVRVEQVQEKTGVMVNSEFLNGLPINKATKKMMDHLEECGWGARVRHYHLRDWLISRQRYWGPPIPMIFCKTCADKNISWFDTEEADTVESLSDEDKNWAYGWYPAEEKELPVVLPRVEDFRPGDDGIAPLAKVKDFVEVACPHCGDDARRETDVSDTFLDSSWYFLRYPTVDTKNSKKTPFDTKITKKWLPVDMYTGGAEHSVLHLMYSRFVTMVLHDLGLIDFEEPFSQFFAHGLVIKDGAKMSKSKGNVVNPDEYIALYGADALRLYLMFMGPFSQGGDFRDTAMEGMSRWVGRVKDVIKKAESQTQPAHATLLSKLIKKVGEDLEKRRYNTAIAAMMEFTNTVKRNDHVLTVKEARDFVLLLAPFAPYVSEQLWQQLHDRSMPEKKKESVHAQRWPVYRDEDIQDETVSMIVQVNGRLRDTFEVSASSAEDKDEMIAQAKQRDNIRKYLNTAVKKVIFVPKRLVNFVL